MAYPRLLAAALIAAPAAAFAQSAPDTTLPPVGVTATRGAKPIDEVPATVSVIPARQIERQSVVRPGDLVRYEPGITVNNQPGRAGQGNYTIRGIGENRVLVLQDGLRVQDFPSTNVGAGTYTRNFTDLENLKRVEILRGPASALYGSDALGGVVNYIIKDPADYLDVSGRDTYVSGKLGYNGSDNSLSETITGAARMGKTDLLLMYTRRDGSETRNKGTPSANPQTSQSNALLARLVVHATDADTIRLTGEYTGRLVSTGIVSEQTNTPPAGFTPGTKVFSAHGVDNTQRAGMMLDWAHEAPLLFIDTLRARLSFSKLERREQTDRYAASYGGAVAPAVPNRRRISDFRFDQELAIADLQATSNSILFGTEHRFTYGGTVERTETTRPRDRREINMTTGAIAATVAGETYPNKNFPDTTTTQIGLYVQDEIRIGRLELTPALRADFYDLKPSPDALSNRSSAGLVVKPLSEAALSPKLGAVYKLTDQYSVYGQYAHGFRAPPYDSTNFGFTNAAFGYQILPNAGLKSETSDGFEGGFRGKYADGSWQINGFYNQYRNFIDTRVVGTSASGLQQFKYVNVSNVKIWGAEARGDYRIAPEWTLRGAAAWARGEDSTTGKPVDSVDPIKLVAGLSYQHTNGFGADAVLTHAWRHDRVSDQSFFKAPSYTVLDLMLHYDVNKNVTVNGGIYNITDAKYIVSQDVNGLARTSAVRDLYTQPGRYFALNATVRW